MFTNFPLWIDAIGCNLTWVKIFNVDLQESISLNRQLHHTLLRSSPPIVTLDPPKKLQSFEKTFLQQKNHNDTRTCWLWQISKHLQLMCFYKSFRLTKKAPKVKKSVIKTCDQRNKLNNTGEPTVISWSPSVYVHLAYCVVTKPSQTFGITCFKLMYLVMTFSQMGTHLFHRLLLKE